MNLTSGTKLGPYEIVSLLGAGGMGEVYRARDARLKREVAIKVLPKALSLDPDRLRRFEQEALATAALNHPNILAVFDIGSHDGAPYVVSELLEGETLRERLRSGAIPLRKSLDYALQMAHGLAAAHEKGIVHRDLKPENLFLTKDGRVKILDFGLAKLTQADPASHTSLPTMTHVTEAGTVMGTAGYMSPEQVRGVAVDARSDIFSFGTILYEMISGKRAFHGETPADTMSAILKEEPGELSETNRNVSPALERIVHHCLEKNPEQRFHSASDIAFDLEHLSGTSGPSARVSTVPAARPKVGLLALIASCVGIALVMLGVGWWLGRNGNAAPLAEYKQITFRTGSIGNARFAPDGSVVYSAAWDGGDNQMYIARMDNPGSRELGLKNSELLAISKNGEMAVRLKTTYLAGYARSGTLARVPLSGGTPREVLDNVQDADWSGDGETMAIVRHVTENGHWRLEYPIGKVLLDSIQWISHPKISPDGKWVAFADHENNLGDDEGSIAVIGLDGKGGEKKISSGWESIEGVVWSPDGSEVWFTATNGGSGDNPYAVTLSGKQRTITRVPGGMWLQDMHNGTVLAITHQQRVDIRGLAPGAKTERELGWFGWSILRDISQDGRKIVFSEAGDGGGPNYTVFIRDTDGSPPSRISDGDAMAISPDGKWVVTRPAQGSVLSLVPTGAGETKKLTHDAVAYNSARWLPDGKHLLAAGIEAGHGVRDYVIDLDSGDAKPITPEGIAGTMISPDGKSALVRAADGKWGIWPLDGSGMRTIPGNDSSFNVVRWAPDGKSIYVVSDRADDRTSKIYQLDLGTGKMTFWKTFGEESAGVVDTRDPHFSRDGIAYAYDYVRVISEAYVVTGLR
ncbi:MAG TPA: WD40 repeat domain-containing serine/threonine protein kinase [Candidatus Aquilonibacter sp.]|jgi:Tol biopolymer transport system component|nr:WD40 repeat domain-containing serine/threonine protein kinase [Candidatus Aquilonibacter sp.]